MIEDSAKQQIATKKVETTPAAASHRPIIVVSSPELDDDNEVSQVLFARISGYYYDYSY